MKLHKISIGVLCFVFALAFSVSIAQAETTVNANADVQVTTGNVKPKPPLPPLRSGDKKVLDIRKDTRDERKKEVQDIRTDVKGQLQGDKAKMNSDIKAMKGTLNDSSTPQQRMDLRLTVEEMRQNFKGERQTALKTMKQDIFKVRKTALGKQLTTTLENLTTNRTRIDALLTKLEGAGKDTTTARASLVLADAKLAAAKVAVDAFIALPDPAPTKTTTTTTTDTSASASVDVTKPRLQGDAAIKALKEARDAFFATIKLAVIIKTEMKTDSNATVTK